MTGFLAFLAILILYRTFVKLWLQVPQDAPEFTMDEIHYCTTEDQWRIALSRKFPTPSSTKKEIPVVLCPGLGATRFTYLIAGKDSLPSFLSSLGYEVWIVEYRGRGLSQKPHIFSNHSYGWNFDTYLKQDLPAVIQTILQKTGSEKVHLIGHSMGAILSYCAILPDQPLSDSVQSATLIGGSLDYSLSDSDYHKLIPARRYLSWLPMIPAGELALWFAPFTMLFKNPIDRFMFHPSEMNRKSAQRLYANGFNAISFPVLSQLATAFSSGGLQSSSTKSEYSLQLPKVSIPCLTIGGEKDRQCPPEALAPTYEKAGSASKKTHSFPNGHFDLLLGKNTRSQIFPVIQEWLES